METIERSEFWDRYHFRPTQLLNTQIGGTYKGKCGEFKVVEKNHIPGMVGTITYEYNGQTITADLTPHWERGPVGEIHICREGAMNLIGAVMAQTEKDLELYYAYGEKEYQVETLVDEKGKPIFESSDHRAKRRKSLYERAVRECEEFLGPTFSKYTMIKAYYQLLKLTEKEIARRMGESEYHIECVISRLGLYPSILGQEDTF